MIKKKITVFERHPVLTIVFINLFFIGVWLSIDLIYSNFISSFTYEYKILESVKPIGHMNRKNKTFRWQNRHAGGYDAEVTLNNLGFRNSEDFNDQTIKGKKVIFAMGDSTTAAFENSYNASYPKVLNDILGKETVVFNAGVRGFDTNQVIINYQTQLRKLKPDAVIYMICDNDLGGNVNPEYYKEFKWYYGKGSVKTEDGTFTFIEPVQGMQRNIIDLKIFLVTNFNLSFQKIYKPLTALLKRKHIISVIQKDDFEPYKQKKLEELLVILNNLTYEDQIPLFITWFPELTRGDEANTKIHKYYKKTRAFVTGNLKNSFFIPTYEPLLKYYKENPATKETEFKLPYDGHASDFGSIKLSNIIGHSLKQELSEHQ